MESVFSGAFALITALLRLTAFVAGGGLTLWFLWRYSSDLQSFLAAMSGYAEGCTVSMLGCLRGLIASDWVLPWLAFAWAVASIAVGIAAGLFQVDERLPRRPGRYWYSQPGATAAALRRWVMARGRASDEGERRLVPNSYLKQLADGFPYSRPRRD